MAEQQQHGTASTPRNAHMVGKQFVNHYYHISHHDPQLLHKFYTDASMLTQAEAGAGADDSVDAVVSPFAIQQKLLALDYGGFQAKISTIDSQNSLSGGVLVMITGSIYTKFTGKRNFVQSVFLASNEPGSYVILNDIFRYLDDDMENLTRKQGLQNGEVLQAPQVDVISEPEISLQIEHEVQETSLFVMPVIEPTTVENFDSPAQLLNVADYEDEHEVQETSLLVMPVIEPTTVENFDSPPQHLNVADAEDDAKIEDLTRLETAPVIDEARPPIAALSGAAQSLEENSDEAPKKSYASVTSYASILQMEKKAGSPLPSPTNTTAPKTATPTIERPAPTIASPTAKVTSQDSLDGGAVAAIGNDWDGKSVYVKNLPIGSSSSQIEEELRKFGVLKRGGVNVKNHNPSVCYAFVEYEEATSAKTAIESSPIFIGGRPVYMEEKRPMGPRFGGTGGRRPSAGQVDRSLQSDKLLALRAGRAPFTGGGRGGRPSGQDITSSGRETGPAPAPGRGGSGNFEGRSNNISSNDGTGGGASVNATENHRSRAPRRVRNQNLQNGAISGGSPPVAAV